MVLLCAHRLGVGGQQLHKEVRPQSVHSGHYYIREPEPGVHRELLLPLKPTLPLDLHRKDHVCCSVCI